MGIQGGDGGGVSCWGQAGYPAAQQSLWVRHEGQQASGLLPTTLHLYPPHAKRSANSITGCCISPPPHHSQDPSLECMFTLVVDVSDGKSFALVQPSPPTLL